MSNAPRRAAFLDRDGTVIVDRHYPSDPDEVQLLPGSARAIRMIAEAGYVIVLVTNQSGIARGMFGEAGFRAVQERMMSLLAAEGAAIDAVYMCPHHPDHGRPCDCRKPELGLYRRAAVEHGLDLASSVYIGDKMSDVLPALVTGGRGILVRTGHGADAATAAPADIAIVEDLAAAARLIGRWQGRHDVDMPPVRE